IGRQRPVVVAVRREGVLQGVGQVGDWTEPDDPRRALERVGDAEERADGLSTGPAPLELDGAAGERLREPARLDPEVLERSPGHRRRADSERTSRLRSRESVASWLDVWSVCVVATSDSRAAWAMPATATLTCSTALACCRVESSISCAAWVETTTDSA